MVEVGKDVWRWTSPTFSAENRFTSSRLLRAMSRLPLSISQDGDLERTHEDHQIQLLTPQFLCLNGISCIMPIAGTGHNWDVSLHLLYSPPRYLYTVIRCSLGLSPFVRYLNPLTTLRTIPRTLSSKSMLSLCWRTQSSTQQYRCVSPALNRRAGSPPLICWPCSAQSRPVCFLCCNHTLLAHI